MPAKFFLFLRVAIFEEGSNNPQCFKIELIFFFSFSRKKCKNQVFRKNDHCLLASVQLFVLILNYFSPISTIFLAGSTIVYTPIQCKKRQKHFIHTNYIGKMPDLA